MDKNKIILIITYIFLSILLIIYIPYFFLNGGMSSSLWNSSFGKGLIKLVQLAFVIFDIVILGMLLKNQDDSNSGLFKKNTVNQGTAHKGNINELKGLTVPVNAKKNAGFILSKNVRLSLDKSFEHVAIIGPTGAGKSTTFFIPCLLDADGTYSIVIIDPKKELYEKTHKYLESLGMDTIQLMPLNPEENKLHYNPLLTSETNTQIRELAQLILVNGSRAVEMQMGRSSGGGDQASWINMAIPLFTAALAYVKKFGTRKSIVEAIDIILDIDIDKKALDKAEEMFKKDPISLKNFKIFKSAGGSDKTISSIKSVLSSNIQLFLDENIESFTKTPFNFSHSTGELLVDNSKLFNPKRLREKPTALFVSVEEIKSDYVSPLMSVFYNQLLDICMSNFDDDKYKYPVLFLLDEFANIGIIPNIEKIAATARSRKLGLSIGIQGIEQLKNNYGEENANTILNNLKTKVFYPGLAMETAKYASELAGYGTVESRNISSGDSNQNVLSGLINGPNVSVSGVRRELYTHDEIRRLKEDKLLIIAHNRNPVEDEQNKYYKQNKYIKKVNMN